MALLDTYALRQLMWKKGPRAAGDLIVQLNRVEARLKALGLSTLALDVSRKVSQFQIHVQTDVDVNSLGEPFEFSHAMDAPKGTLEAAEDALDRTESALLMLPKPFGRMRLHAGGFRRAGSSRALAGRDAT